METTVITVKVTNDVKLTLRDMAANMGFTIGRGSHPEWGSITQMIEAIADGRYLVVKNPTLTTAPAASSS